jgi:hypothetical protein
MLPGEMMQVPFSTDFWLIFGMLVADWLIFWKPLIGAHPGSSPAKIDPQTFPCLKMEKCHF